MPSCLNSIVTLGICPDEGEPKSGLKLVNAAGISIKNLSQIATESYNSGVNLAMQKKDMAMILLRNDFVGALQANNVVANISNVVYDTSVFNPSVDGGTYAGYRGLQLHRVNSRRSRLRSTFISKIYCHPLVSGDTTLRITDGYTNYDWDVTLVANQTNVFDASTLSDFPYKLQSDNVKILFDNTSISFAKTDIKCGKGCDGGVPNPCGWADGWDGSASVKGAGYGVGVDFYCECDYETILCELSNSFSGELLWIKWQILIFEEQYLSNRFNSLVTYNHDELNTVVLPDLRNKYNAKWNDLMNGLYNILSSYKDDCITCKGISWKTVI